LLNNGFEDDVVIPRTKKEEEEQGIYQMVVDNAFDLTQNVFVDINHETLKVFLDYSLDHSCSRDTIDVCDKPLYRDWITGTDNIPIPPKPKPPVDPLSQLVVYDYEDHHEYVHTRFVTSDGEDLVLATGDYYVNITDKYVGKPDLKNYVTSNGENFIVHKI